MTALPQTSDKSASRPTFWKLVYWMALLVLLLAVFADALKGLWANYSRPGSYYTHGPIVPLISAFFAWRQRDRLRELPKAQSWLGAALVAAACLLVLMGDFLGFRIFAQFSLLLMVAGVVAATFSWKHVKALWFPLAFLLFMIPIPDSITQSLILNIKLAATEAAVTLAHLVSLPMIRDGSFVIFKNDRLLVGEVCGGLRSLIALLAMGAIMSYVSQSRWWARLGLLLLAAPIALAANILRIFFLCVVAWFWGSNAAVGVVHDISGIMIYVLAFALFFAVETLLRKKAPADTDAKGGAWSRN